MPAPRTRRGFRNPDSQAGPRPFLTALRWGLTRSSSGPDPEPVSPSDHPAGPVPSGAVRVISVGHATTLIEFPGGAGFLTDPVYSERCSPLPFAGPRRFSPPGIPFEQLPPLAAVLLSHNHYDHLDRPTIQRLLKERGQEQLFLVPLGLGRWFRKLGAHRVRELDWEESVEISPGLTVTAVPAQHWSRRGLFDTNRSLWSAYVIACRAGGRRVFFAGDTGYGEHFRLIGERYGPFDCSVLPIGAYNPAYMMATVHMTPEEAVQAWLDLGGQGVFLAAHHRVFRLTDEPPEEPAARLRAEWSRLALPPDSLWIADPGEWRLVE